MDKTKNVLNQAVADLSQFAVMIHQVHWYMRSKNFLSMHPKMDEFMDEINEQLDEVAERLITIGGAPYATLEEFAANTKLKSQKGDFGIPLEKHLETLLDGYVYLAHLYQDGIVASNEEDDDVTADLFTTLRGAIDKKIWMLSATLEKENPAL